MGCGGRFRAVFFLLVVGLVDVRAPAFAQSRLGEVVEAVGPDDLAAMGTSKVVGIIDGDTVILEDGRQVRLTGIQAPKLSLGRRNFPDWPLGPEAGEALGYLLLGRVVTLRASGATQDRHGRVLAHLVTQEGLWAQGEMLTRGLARVYTFADNRNLADALLERERAARAAGRGIWADAFYDVRSPADLKASSGTFQIVEGDIVSAQRIKNTVYLNFGPNWRTDFTVSFDARMLDAFKVAGRDPLAWAGQRVRVRGWITEKNGPWIELTHPEAIEAPLDK